MPSSQRRMIRPSGTPRSQSKMRIISSLASFFSDPGRAVARAGDVRGRLEPHAVIADAHRLTTGEPPTDARAHEPDEDRGHRGERAVAHRDREVRIGRLSGD